MSHEILYKMLDEMPEFEICKIKLWNSNTDLINTLATKSIFRNKQDLFNKLELCGCKQPENSEQHEYLSKVLNPENYDMS